MELEDMIDKEGGVLLQYRQPLLYHFDSLFQLAACVVEEAEPGQSLLARVDPDVWVGSLKRQSTQDWRILMAMKAL